MRIRAFVIGCLLFALASWATAAAAMISDPEPWPEGSVITYYDESGWGRNVEAAATQWNRLDLGVRFEEVSDPIDARVVIRETEDLPCAEGESCRAVVSHVGYQHLQTLISLRPSDEQRERTLDPYVETIVHEFGHVLGLTHTDEPCSIMKSGDRFCPVADIELERGYYRMLCGPFDHDLAQIRKLYGDFNVPDEFHRCLPEPW